MKLPELLIPAGNLEKLTVAVHGGADAVYLSGKRYGLRSYAGNFTLPEIEEGVSIAHGRGVKVYVTVNIVARNHDLAGLADYLIALRGMGVDGLIVSDPGILDLARTHVPGMPLHLSTQLSTSNWSSALFWQKQGVARINLARELSLQEIADIKSRVSCEIEVFVHGAICVAYSGRCLISTYLAHRDSNRGECAHPCRWRYALMEEKRPQVFFPIAEDEHGSYIFNAKDLCLIEHLPAVIATGVDSLKIEGRMKGIHYVAGVTRVYRHALDCYKQDPEHFEIRPRWLEELKSLSHRDYTTGFAFTPPAAEDYTYASSDYIRTHELVGKVTATRPAAAGTGSPDAAGWITVQVRNRITAGEWVEFVDRDLCCHRIRLDAMTDGQGTCLREAHAGQEVLIRADLPVGVNDLLRKRKS